MNEGGCASWLAVIFFLLICRHTILEGGSERNFSGCPYADTTPGFLAFWLPQGLNGCIRCSGDA